jgi:putative zinc finger/helix-turn-helix YgiT family protein
MTGLCAVCSSDRVTKIRKDFPARYNQTPIVVRDAEMYECADCGERFFEPEQAKALSLAIKEEARRIGRLLSPKQIVAIRERLGLTQNALEDLLGLGPKVVTRWETGRVLQSRAADVVLRLLEFDPKNLEKLREGRHQLAGAER